MLFISLVLNAVVCQRSSTRCLQSVTSSSTSWLDLRRKTFETRPCGSSWHWVVR